MTYVLGIDSSTQSCKAVLVDAASGEIIDQARASHPGGTQVDPQKWIEALDEVTTGLLDKADAVAVAGQQHGMVALDSENNTVRDAMLWNDVCSADAAQELVEELGGAKKTVDLTGSVLVASFTGTKLRWLRDNEPENAQKVSRVVLPHDYLTWHLGGREEFTTDHGDASGTGYYSTRQRRFLPELAEQFLGRSIELPRIAEPNEIVGHTAQGTAIAAGTGDNMAAALGLDLQPGDICVSVGTSGVASAWSKDSVHDATGQVTGFSDATGAYLPLACTLNGAKVLDFAANLLGVDHKGLSQLALDGNSSVTLLPYFDGERTPNRPQATGLLSGLRTDTTREDFARGVVEGLLCSMLDAIKAVENAMGYKAKRVLLTGGAARSEAMQKLAPSIFGVDVVLPAPGEYVALGAARQAAWALSGSDTPPKWDIGKSITHRGEANPETVARYGRIRDLTANF